MKAHAENSNEKEVAFSQNLEELKKAEIDSKKEVEAAQKRKESAILAAREDAEKMQEDSEEEIAKEKEKIIEKGVKEIQKDVSTIIEKAQKEGDKIKKTAEPQAAAKKMLEIVLERV